MSELRHRLRKLEKLAENCGASEKKDTGPAVDMSKMTEYEKGQYKLADQMQNVRRNIQELDEIGEKGSAARKAELNNAIRRGIATMKKDTAEVKKAAHKEKKREEYEKLVSHVKKTEGLYKSRFLNMDEAGEGDDSTNSGGGGGGIRRNAINLEDDNQQPMLNLREDPEFQQFFDQVHANDQKMDQALDRISAGITALHVNAQAMGEELKVQKELLKETERKVDKIDDDLQSLNKRLRKTIKSIQNDKLCIYMICFILLLALGGVIYYIAQRNSK